MWKTGMAMRVRILSVLVLVLLSVSAVSAQDQAVTIRWDIIKVSTVDGKPNIAEGGAAFTSANDGSYIMLTGSGTFDTSMASAPTGGGDWMTFDVTNAMIGNGSYTVSGFVSWSEGPGTEAAAQVDTIGDKADFRAGV